MENGSKKIGLRILAGFLVAITIIVAVFASGIQLPSTKIETGRLTVLLKDAPVDVDELWITVTDLEVHKVGEDDGEWIPIDFSVYYNELTFDLLEYQDENGKVLELADVEIAEGTYNKIRMNVTKAWAWYYLEFDENGDPVDVDENGKPTNEEMIKKDPLKIPPDQIDVITKFYISNGVNVVVLIDMEPDWVSISNSNNLRPVLKASISQQEGS